MGLFTTAIVSFCIGSAFTACLYLFRSGEGTEPSDKDLVEVYEHVHDTVVLNEEQRLRAITIAKKWLLSFSLVIRYKDDNR